MAAETELTIVVRVKDAATRALGAMKGVLKTALLAPLHLAYDATKNILKQFFSLKALLVGGGIFAVINNVTKALAKNAKVFEPIISDETQQRIDATASAFNRLGATFKAVLAEIVSRVKLDEILNSVSDWIRDHKDDVLGFFNDVAEHVSMIVNGIARAVKDAKGGLSKEARTQNWLGANEDRRANPELYDQWAPKEDPMGSPRLGSDSRPTVTQEQANATKKQAEVVREVESAYRAEAKSIQTVVDNQRELNEVVGEYLKLGDVASSVSNNFTDSLFEFVDGTMSAATAFRSMVSSILRDLARLLVQRSIFEAVLSIAGAASSSFTTASGSLSGDATSSGIPVGGLRGGFASGGSVHRGGSYMVGEQGPERVYLPSGSYVKPSHRSRGDGGNVTVNIHDATDPGRVAQAVIAALGFHGGLRTAMRGAVRAA